MQDFGRKNNRFACKAKKKNIYIYNNVRARKKERDKSLKIQEKSTKILETKEKSYQENETVTNCHALKMTAADGKMHLTGEQEIAEMHKLYK